MTINEAIQKLIEVEKAEVGYLEKESNKYLDSDTKNAGDNNFTKFWRDLKNWGLGNYQGSYWCAAFQHWCFVGAFGQDDAKKLLMHAPFIYCPTIANLFKKDGRLYSEPKVGDIVVFKGATRFNHTGFVYKVDSTKFYTIEGNTSGASGVVRNGGGVAKKSYSISEAKKKGHKFCRIDYSLITTIEESKNEPTPAKKPEAKKEYIDFGDKGTAVKEVQKMLIKCGYSCGDAGADGEFGNNTLKAIKKFEKDYKLTVDGVVDDKTLAKLKEIYKQATESIKVDPAAYFNKKYNADYKTTSDLNLRVGAGSSKQKITTIPKGKTVECYGYYSKALGKVWLLVKYDKHTGFCSIDYLKKK